MSTDAWIALFCPDLGSPPQTVAVAMGRRPGCKIQESGHHGALQPYRQDDVDLNYSLALHQLRRHGGGCH
jgi:hypothetical protein